MPSTVAEYGWCISPLLTYYSRGTAGVSPPYHGCGVKALAGATIYMYVCICMYVCSMCIYVYIYISNCVCQHYHKECSTRTCADDCYNCWKKSNLKSYVLEIGLFLTIIYIYKYIHTYYIYIKHFNRNGTETSSMGLETVLDQLLLSIVLLYPILRWPVFRIACLIIFWVMQFWIIKVILIMWNLHQIRRRPWGDWGLSPAFAQSSPWVSKHGIPLHYTKEKPFTRQTHTALFRPFTRTPRSHPKYANKTRKCCLTHQPTNLQNQWKQQNALTQNSRTNLQKSTGQQSTTHALQQIRGWCAPGSPRHALLGRGDPGCHHPKQT